MDMGGSAVHIIAAIGCSLILFAFLRNARTDSTQMARENGRGASPIKPSVSSAAGKKKVRFSEEVLEPSRNNVEYRKRRGGKRVAGTRRREGEVVVLQANRSALYRGMYRYRSQMSTLMMYG